MTAKEFQESGLLYLANRAVHPFGVALAVVREEGGRVRNELVLVESDDPAGFTFDEETENECRRRLSSWIRRCWNP